MTTTITREQIHKVLQSKEPLTLVEALPARHFQAAHLPGAMNIPHDEINEKAPEMLPDRDAPIVVYCSNRQCQNSKIAAHTLRTMGYTNVKEYTVGKQDWIDANLAIEHGK